MRWHPPTSLLALAECYQKIFERVKSEGRFGTFWGGFGMARL
jgi:hypothetical protein